MTPSRARIGAEGRGEGINVAILDTGVDDSHSAFPDGTYRAGYNAVTGVEENPPDDDPGAGEGSAGGHGTHVASIVLGRAWFGGPRGVAPRAGLVDVKVIGDSLPPPAIPTGDCALGGLEWVMENRNTYNIKVICMAFGSRDPDTDEWAPSDGNDALCQAVDRAVVTGMFVATAVGNEGHAFPPPGPITAPGAAALAMTVAASDDMEGSDRTNDEIAEFSTNGPREPDDFFPDSDLYDELKPEVTAPGVDIDGALRSTLGGVVTLSGTFMAAAHVAGLAAIAYGVAYARDRELSPGVIKAALIDSAERIDLSEEGNPTWYERSPEWNHLWGWGLVNGCLAVEQANASFTDVDFNRIGSPRHWAQRSLFPGTEPPRHGVPNELRARLRNNGPGGTARDVKVEFAVQVLTAGVPTFSHIGTVDVAEIRGATSCGTPSGFLPAGETSRPASAAAGPGSAVRSRRGASLRTTPSWVSSSCGRSLLSRRRRSP